MRQNRQERLEGALALIEAEFRAKLIAELRRCAGGTWGLFRQNSHLGDYDHKTPELDKLGLEIQQIRNQLGMAEPFSLYDRLLKDRGRKTSNDPGEPRLASLWLQELGE